MVEQGASHALASKFAWFGWRHWSLRIRRPALRLRFPLAMALGVVVAGVGGGFAVVAGVQPDQAALDLGAPSVFYALPEMVTALDGASARQRYVRLALVLEVPETETDLLQAGEPAILDSVQQHLRSLRPADLTGEAGAQLLRGAVRGIVEKRLRPSELRGVLFTQLLID